MQEDGRPFFREIQRFNQRWIVVVVSLTALGSWFMFLFRFLAGRPQRSGALEDALLVFTWILAGVGVPLLFLTMQLVTEVREDGFYVKFVPFHRRFRVFRWEELQGFQVRRYRPLKEYGGWGIRWGPAGRAYNVSGDRGLQLVFKNGRRLLLGSQRAQELEEAARRARENAMAPPQEGG